MYRFHIPLTRPCTIKITKFAVITLKFEQGGFTTKDADGMANSVDPDQTDLDLHCLPRHVCPKNLILTDKRNTTDFLFQWF